MTASSPPATPIIPNTLKWAAWLAFAYAAVVIANATALQFLTDWVEARDYPRGLIRAGGFALIGYGLLRRARWAWWISIGLSSLLLLVGVVGMVAFFAVRTPEADTMLPPMFVPVAIVTIALLAAMVVLLAHPRSRAASRSAAV